MSAPHGVLSFLWSCYWVFLSLVSLMCFRFSALANVLSFCPLMSFCFCWLLLVSQLTLMSSHFSAPANVHSLLCSHNVFPIYALSLLNYRVLFFFIRKCSPSFGSGLTLDSLLPPKYFVSSAPGSLLLILCSWFCALRFYLCVIIYLFSSL